LWKTHGEEMSLQEKAETNWTYDPKDQSKVPTAALWVRLSEFMSAVQELKEKVWRLRTDWQKNSDFREGHATAINEVNTLIDSVFGVKKK